MVLIRGDVFHMLFRKYAVLNPVQQSKYNAIKLYEFIHESFNLEATAYCVCSFLYVFSY